jgi:glycosyltransferase involved in cell wall biosynthesis
VREALRAVAREPALAPRAATQPVLAWQVSVFWSSLRPRAAEVVARARPDVLSVEHDYAGSWSQVAPEVPAVLTLENVSFAYYRSRADAAGGVRRWPHEIEARRFLRHDRSVLPRYARLVACSERDRQLVEPVFEGSVDVVPNGVDTTALAAQPSSDGSPTLLFTGTMNYPPNEEGARWLAGRVWPEVRARRPDARLLIVGRGPSASLRALDGREGIEVTGPVPDMTDYFRAATVVVVPIRSGGGTRLKVLEAFAAQRPVVSTGVGIEGIEAEAGVHALVEDAPEAFAAAALELIEAPERRAALAAQARALVERRYDWRELGDRFEASLREAAA